MGVEFGKLLLKSGHFYRTIFDSVVKNYESLQADLLTRTDIDVNMEIETLNFNYYVDAVNKYDQQVNSVLFYLRV